jgi:hypothetical protein
MHLVDEKYFEMLQNINNQTQINFRFIPRLLVKILDFFVAPQLSAICLAISPL